MKFGDFLRFLRFPEFWAPGGVPFWAPFLGPPHFRPRHQNRKSLPGSGARLDSGKQKIPAGKEILKFSQN